MSCLTEAGCETVAAVRIAALAKQVVTGRDKKLQPMLAQSEPVDDMPEAPLIKKRVTTKGKYQPETWTDVWDAVQEFKKEKKAGGVGRQGFIDKYDKLFSEPALRKRLPAVCVQHESEPNLDPLVLSYAVTPRGLQLYLAAKEAAKKNAAAENKESDT